jgi:hypothetical protein
LGLKSLQDTKADLKLLPQPFPKIMQLLLHSTGGINEVRPLDGDFEFPIEQ